MLSRIAAVRLQRCPHPAALRPRLLLSAPGRQEGGALRSSGRNAGGGAEKAGGAAAGGSSASEETRNEAGCRRGTQKGNGAQGRVGSDSSADPRAVWGLDCRQGEPVSTGLKSDKDSRVKGVGGSRAYRVAGVEGVYIPHPSVGVGLRLPTVSSCRLSSCASSRFSLLYMQHEHASVLVSSRVMRKKETETRASKLSRAQCSRRASSCRHVRHQSRHSSARGLVPILSSVCLPPVSARRSWRARTGSGRLTKLFLICRQAATTCFRVFW